MRYKTSCFNPTLFRHNLRRFWPLPLLLLVFYILLLDTNYYTSLVAILSSANETAAAARAGIQEYVYSPTEQMLRSSRLSVYYNADALIWIQLFTAIISALPVMLHIHSRKQIQFYHGLPLSRRCIYITNGLSGYLMALVPLLLAECIMAVIALIMGVEVFPIFQLTGVSLAAFTVFYGMAIISCVLAGQSFGAVLLYGGSHCFFLVICAGAAGVARFILPGYNGDILLEPLVRWLTPIYQMLRNSSPLYTEVELGMPYGYRALPFLVYWIAGILLLALGSLLYQYRRGETAGEMISFSFIRTLCKILVALMAGLGGTVLLVEMVRPTRDVTFPVVTLAVLILAVLGWLAAEMVIRKTFRILRKKILVSCLCLLVPMLLILVGARLDVFGYVNHIPKEDQVVKCQIMLNGTPVYVTPGDALKLHSFVLENRESLGNRSSRQNANTIYLEYFDEDGDSVLSRAYHVKGGLSSPVMETFMEIMSNPDYVWQSWFAWQETPITRDYIQTAQLYTHRHYTGDDEGTPYLLKDGKPMVNDWQDLTPEESEKLYGAILRDIQSGALKTGYLQYFSSDTEYGVMEFNVFTEAYDPAKWSYAEYLKYVGSNYHNITIYPDMNNTLAVLEDMGYTLNPEALG